MTPLARGFRFGKVAIAMKATRVEVAHTFPVTVQHPAVLQVKAVPLVAVNLCQKDLARLMGLSVDSVKRWLKRLDLHPTCEGHAAHRWSEADAEIFIEAWKVYCRKNKPKYGTRMSKPARRCPR